MSLDPRPPSPNSAALPKNQFELEAHTESANALAQKLLHGWISQKDYDAQIYSTTIASTDRATPIPIITTLDETLAALLAYANLKFGIPLAKAHMTKMYVLPSAEIIYAMGGHALPGILFLLDQDKLEMVLRCMKQGSQVKQFFVEFEDDMAETKAGSNTTALKGIWPYEGRYTSAEIPAVSFNKW